MFEGERKRNGNPSRVKKPSVSFREGFKLWLNSWRWSEIKKTWSTEYRRVHSNANYHLNTISDKLNR